MVSEKVSAHVDIGNLVDAITRLLSGEYVVAVGALAATLLFGPQFALRHLGVEGWVAQYRPWIVVAFLLCLYLILARFLFILGRSLWKHVSSRRSRKAALARLHCLSNDEKSYLSSYANSGISSLNFHPSDGVPKNLEADGLLLCSSDAQDHNGCVPYTILPLAANYLKLHPELLKK